MIRRISCRFQVLLRFWHFRSRLANTVALTKVLIFFWYYDTMFLYIRNALLKPSLFADAYYHCSAPSSPSLYPPLRVTFWPEGRSLPFTDIVTGFYPTAEIALVVEPNQALLDQDQVLFTLTLFCLTVYTARDAIVPRLFSHGYYGFCRCRMVIVGLFRSYDSSSRCTNRCYAPL